MGSVHRGYLPMAFLISATMSSTIFFTLESGRWMARLMALPQGPQTWACLVNRLVPRRGREKGEKNPKAVGDELQKRPRHEARSPAAPPLEEGGRKVAR